VRQRQASVHFKWQRGRQSAFDIPCLGGEAWVHAEPFRAGAESVGLRSHPLRLGGQVPDSALVLMSANLTGGQFRRSRSETPTGPHRAEPDHLSPRSSSAFERHGCNSIGGRAHSFELGSSLAALARPNSSLQTKPLWTRAARSAVGGTGLSRARGIHVFSSPGPGPHVRSSGVIPAGSVRTTSGVDDLGSRRAWLFGRQQRGRELLDQAGDRLHHVEDRLGLRALGVQARSARCPGTSRRSRRRPRGSARLRLSGTCPPPG
jgi:hypothetical protein